MHEGMPAPLAEHKKLEALAGTWVGEETMHPSPFDPKGGSAVGKTTSRMDLDGFFLICDYIQERGGQVSYRGHGVIGYDADKKDYTFHWFDSMGSPACEPSRGNWKGNTLTFEMAGPMGHSRYAYTLEADNRYLFTIQMSQDGKQWAPFMEGRYSRK